MKPMSYKHLKKLIFTLELKLITQALRDAGSVMGAAKKLKMSRSTLRWRMKVLGLK